MTCTYQDCDHTDIRGRGYCSKHYRRGQNEGWWGTPRACSHAPCRRVVYCQRLCKGHYRQSIDGQPLTALKPKAIERDEYGRKFCTSCKEWLLESKFSRSDKKDGLSFECKTCQSARLRYKRYRVTLPVDVKCDMCEGDNQGRTIHVDHDHSCCEGPETCGECVRGFLCYTCNLRLSVLENSQWRTLAEHYLEQHRNRRTIG